jgi:NADPH2:quinone reductase
MPPNRPSTEVFTMRAAFYERTGPAHEVLTLGEVPTPSPGPAQVRVRVVYSGINPHDTKRRSRWTGGEGPPGPVVPHFDASGVIESVGHGVDPGRVGERVWVFRAHGTAGEFAVVPSANAVPLPDAVPLPAGACLGVPGLTAHLALSGDGDIAGQTILVQGGAGAVASYAIQSARHRGARVIATVSSAEKAALARRLGAEATVDYRATNALTALQAAAPAGYDRIVEVDFGANIGVDVEIIRPHGVIASYSSTRVREPVLPYYPLQFKAVTIRCVQGMLLTDAQRTAGTDELTRLMQAGKLQHPAAHTFPIDRIADAHTALESGTVIGKVIVQVAPEP